MEISGIVDYEKTFHLDVIHPKTDQPFGLTIEVMSSGSSKVTSVAEEQAQGRIDKLIKNKKPQATQITQQTYERYAACIKSWDWGTAPDGTDLTYEGKKPDDSMKEKVRILRKEHWLFGQVQEAADEVVNFT